MWHNATTLMDAKIDRYVAQDRRRALAENAALPDRSSGTALFADIAGFTALGERLTAVLGERRGIESLAQAVNDVYDALIVQVERRAGTVVAFAGDALTCWFDARDAGPAPPARALACAQALQAAMSGFSTPGLKVALASGVVRRFAVGDPDIQRIDTLAGATVARLAAAEELAHEGEIVMDDATAEALLPSLTLREWRGAASGETFAVLESASLADVAGVPASDPPPLPTERLRPWLLRSVFEREQGSHGGLLTELRPTASMFLRFGGIDYDGDDAAEAKLDRVVRSVQAALQEHGGVLLQLTIGDKGSYAYACFGAPIAHEDDLLRALRAAQALRRALSGLGFVDAPQIGIGAGISRTGAYGSRTRAAYGALGDDVNLAARLMMIAAPGQILLGATLRPEAGAEFVLDPLAPVNVKGRSAPVPIHAVRDGAMPPAAARNAALGQSPLVGRADELARIDAALELALQGRGQIIGVCGEAGVGKSRLLAESAVRARRRGMDCLGGACESTGLNSPYLVWRPIVRTLLGLAADDAMPDIGRLEARVRSLAPARAQGIPTLAPALNVEIADNDFTRLLEPKDRAGVLFALLEVCVQAAAAERPLVIMLEDVHWIDPLSSQLLDALLRAVPHLHVCVVIAYRPHATLGREAPYFERLPAFSTMALPGLALAEVEALVRDRLARWQPPCSDALVAALSAWLNVRAEGNAFYIEELLSYLRHRHVDLQELLLAPATLSAALPDSLQALILSRIDRLSESQRAALKAASVIGRQFRIDWLHGCYPLLGSMSGVKADLVELHRLELTTPDRLEPDLACLFKHVITREVTYESLPYATRTLWHGQLAEHLEAQDAQRHVDLLAHHYSLSGKLAKQREFLQRAATAAQRAYANDAAIDYLSRLLKLLETALERTAVQLQLAPLLERVGRWDDARRIHAELITAAEQNGDLAAAAGAEEDLGQLAWRRGDIATAHRYLTRALALHKTAGARPACGRVLALIADLYASSGQGAKAIASQREALAIARATGDGSVEARMLMLSSWIDPEQDDYDGIRSRFVEVIDAARRSGDKAALARAINYLGIVEFEYGEVTRARSAHEEGLALARELGDRLYEANNLTNLSRACWHGRDLPAAEAAAVRAVAILRDLVSASLPNALSRQAEVALMQGKHDIARAALDESVELSRAFGMATYLAGALQYRAYLLLAEGDLERARKVFLEFERLADGADGHTQSLSALVGLAAVAARSGATFNAAVLAAAARRAQREHRRGLDWYREQLLAGAEAACDEGLAAPELQAARAEGEFLTVAQALAFANATAPS